MAYNDLCKYFEEIHESNGVERKYNTKQGLECKNDKKADNNEMRKIIKFQNLYLKNKM